MNKTVLVFIALTALVAVPRAEADEIIVNQKDRKFSEQSVVVHKGQVLTFVNQDPIAHNVYSHSPDLAFDLKIQPPGKSSSVSFDKVGEAEVQCAIHPTMRMTVKVIP